MLTVWSYVLDTDYITATLDDGRKFEAKLVGADPRLEVAVLKIEATDLPHFDLAASVPAESGSRVLAFSNLFGVATGDEPASVQHGIIAVKTRLDARRGAFETPYHGPVYVLDAMTNNPGAAGGALTNQNGELLAMLGKELRSAQNNIWLNYAIPIDELRSRVEANSRRQVAARPMTSPRPSRTQPVDLAAVGMVLVPDVLERTPPYVDDVRAGSPAAQAGLKPDDLVVFVGENLVHSCKGLRDELSRIGARRRAAAGLDARSGTGRSRDQTRGRPGAEIAMSRITRHVLVLGLLTACAAAVRCRSAAADDLPQREERAMKAAVARVAPSVVRIETVGGLERVGQMLIGTGPTTGLVVVDRRLHRLQRVQFRAKARLDPGHARRRLAARRPSWWPPTTAACWCC